MRRKDLLVLTALAAALFLWKLGTPDFWEPDEPDFALISREMAQSGDWIVPTRNGAAYSEKPPLLYWMVAGLARLTGTGVNSWTARLPSASCGVLAVLAVYAAGCRWLTREAGMNAALALMTMPLWVLKARYLLTDMPFAAFTTVALIGLARPLVEGKPPAWWGFVALGLAILAKGPLGGALVVAALALGWLLLRRNPLRFFPHWLFGGMIILAVAAPWYGLVRRHAGVQFFDEVLWGQNFRFVETVSHARGPFYYVLPLLYDLLPWCLPLLAALPLAWKARRESPGVAVVLGWVLGMLVLLSAAKVKQEKYLLPLLPGAALLAGWMLVRSPEVTRWTGRLLAVLLGLIALGLGLSGLLPGLALAAFLCAVCAWRGAAALSLGVFFLAAFSLALPLVNEGKSARPFSERCAVLAVGKPLAYYGEDLQAAFPFYAGRRVDYIAVPRADGLEAYFRANPDALLMLRRRDLEGLPKELSSRLKVVDAWERDMRLPGFLARFSERGGHKDMAAVRWEGAAK